MRKSGLEQFLGSPKLASIMGPDEEMTEPIMKPKTVTICEKCSTEPVFVAALAHEET